MEGVRIYASRRDDAESGGGMINVSTGLMAVVPTSDIADAMAVIISSNITPHELHHIADLLSTIALGAAWRHDPNEGGDDLS